MLHGNEDAWGREFEIAVANAQNPLPARYRHADIRDQLREDLSGKCAYCESHIEHVAYSHIEHIQPKSRVPADVCRWTNLTLACPVCNTQKGDYFDPEAPLLNPYVDNVEDEVCFYGPMALERSYRAKLTISRLKLNRADLLFRRHENLRSISKILDLMERAEGDAALIAALKEELGTELKDSSEYASCSRYFSEAELAHRNLN